MTSRNCDSKTVVLLFLAIFMPDLPWRNLDFRIKSSCAEASDLTDSKLNKRDEASSAPNVILPKLQIESISHMLEKWENISSCEEIIAELANASASLVACFIRNARPITICQNCVEEYVNFYGIYKNICIPNKEACANQFLNKDRLNVVKRSCTFASSLWNDGYCTNCFNKDDLVTTQLNNETKSFLRTYDSVRSCFQDPASQVSTTAGNASVCTSCLKVYSALIKNYRFLKQKYSDEVCMDLTDIMNTTRKLWSGHYDCKVIAARGLYVYLLTTLFCILVVLFYSGFRFIARAQNTRIIEQKRFVSTHSYNSSSGGEHLHSLH